MGDERGDDAANRRNEWVHESIECSGAGIEPFTDAQFESVAHLVAAASRALGLPINDVAGPKFGGRQMTAKPPIAAAPTPGWRDR
jgi:hypothetical protein